MRKKKKVYPVTSDGVKDCARCGQQKPRTDFYVCRTERDGRQAICSICQKEVTADRFKADPERVRLIRWKSYIKHKYGMSWTEYTKWYNDQNGNCAICGDHYEMRAPDRLHDGLHIDHNHETGLVRGMLCRGCNHGLGNMKDSVERLRNAIAYLEEAARAPGGIKELEVNAG